MDQFKKLFGALTPRQLLTIVVVAIAVVGGVMGFSHWERESGMKPLYSGLSPEDASAIVQKLHEGGVDYKIVNNGTELLAPEDKVPELRLEMAGLGLPKTGRIGFEIFDKTNFGITDFAEHVNYRRALEGELERSIMAISDVRQARVHVTLPKDSVFTDARESAKASVLVGLRPGTRLSSPNVIAVENLVSSAVEGLTPEAVSVVDMSGNLLSRPRREGMTDGTQTTEAGLEYRQAIEHDVAAKINSTLEPLLGPDKFRTGVSADIDMTSGEQSEETFDPAKSVMLSSQKTEDSSGTSRVSSAAPGTAANLPPQQTTPSNAPQQTPPAPRPPAQPPDNPARPGPGQARRRASATDSSPHWRQFHHHQPALGKYHLSIQPNHQTSEASPRHRQALVDRGAGGSGIQDGRARGAGPSRSNSSRPRKVESHPNASGNFGWLGHDAGRSTHGGGASLRQQQSGSRIAWTARRRQKDG